ncbi:MAG: aldolase/citrate lyase family protein [Rectinemataceae bacterium]|nr:aldolase/citrate lyase family protein [Rectinemataceae bacterium]
MGAACTVEALGNWDFDFGYLDLEHFPLDWYGNLERLIMTARLAGIPSVVRLTSTDEIEIRKVLEMGAEGVVVPHTRSRQDAEEIVKAAKFHPIGRRGAEANVRAAGFGDPEFSWPEYIARNNTETMIISVDEDFEFTDSLDEILDVPGVDAVNFGPMDYALSVGAKIGYSTEDPCVAEANRRLEEGASKRGIGVMCPIVPETMENVDAAIAKGNNMLILRNDMYHLQSALKRITEECLAPFLK